MTPAETINDCLKTVAGQPTCSLDYHDCPVYHDYPTLALRRQIVSWRREPRKFN